ncbi:MAG TPA: amidohydrolase family protein [Thermoanaerobaculia bacterium]|nr:amidohydrolase family protein [Thermoanaerobaculia bacterium]
MRRLLLLLCLPIAFGCNSAGTTTGGTPTSSPSSGSIAFVDVNVIPMNRPGVTRGQTVIVEEDRIVAVGPTATVRVPEGARVIDGSGKYLLPGLAEMHGHIPPPQAPAQFTEDVLFLYVAAGITTVRGMLGHEGQLELKASANEGTIVSPNLYLAGPSFNGSSINSPEEAIAKVRQQKREGWDLLKVHPGLTRAEYDAMARTAREERIRFGGHVPADVGLAHAIEMGQETMDHVDGYVEHLDGQQKPVDDGKLAEIVRISKDAGVWIVPTMALWETLYGTAPLETLESYEELKYMPRQQVSQWIETHKARLANPQLDPAMSRNVIANRMKILRALNEGGVRILMGTDAPQQFSVPGFALHRELERMSAAGMSSWDILRSGTVNVGEYFREQDSFGTVAQGQRADLLLVDANPLDDIENVAHIAGVMTRGRWLSRQDIDARLAQIAARNAE